MFCTVSVVSAGTDSTQGCMKRGADIFTIGKRFVVKFYHLELKFGKTIRGNELYIIFVTILYL